jgi:hypothetical protein
MYIHHPVLIFVKLLKLLAGLSTTTRIFCVACAQLKARAAVLEKVVACRDEQLEVLSKFQGQCSKAGHESSCFGGREGLPLPNIAQALLNGDRWV